MEKSVEEFLESAGLKLGDRRVFSELARGSSLTEPQLETLLVELAASLAGLRMSVEEKARVRGVSKGAYARTKRQALDNIRRSIYTLLLLRFLGVLGDGAIASLMEAAKMLTQGEAEQALEALKQVMLRDITE